MIKPEELRKGNLLSLTEDSVKYPNTIIVAAVINDEIYYEFPDNTNRELYFHQYGQCSHVCIKASTVHGESLSPEWLERFGFKKIFNGEDTCCDEWADAEHLRLHHDGENYWFGYSFTPKKHLNIAINHVHQLQNLYYALTGQELTFKQTAK